MNQTPLPTQRLRRLVTLRNELRREFETRYARPLHITMLTLILIAGSEDRAYSDTQQLTMSSLRNIFQAVRLNDIISIAPFSSSNANWTSIARLAGRGEGE